MQQVMDTYQSPLGLMELTADAAGLTGLCFSDAASPAAAAESTCTAGEAATLAQTKRWLDVYFSGKEPEHMPPVHMTGTAFQLCVLHLLLQVPYGKTISYGALAARVASRMGVRRMAAQAVGGAVGRNAIAVIVPCHRVIGSDGSLTGYGGGLERKCRLLQLEQGAAGRQNPF